MTTSTPSPRRSFDWLPRFSLWHLLALVSLFGVMLAVLTNANEVLGHLSISASVAAVALSVLATIYVTPNRRAFWVGFAFCGGLYLLLIATPPIVQRLGQVLVTRQINTFVFLAIGPEANKTWDDAFNDASYPLGKEYREAQGRVPAFFQILDSYWTLLFALVGGYFAKAVRQHARHPSVEKRPPS